MEHTHAGVGTEALRAARLVGSDRVLAVLKEVAGHPDGIGLDELTRAMGSPKSTVHRALASLSRAGLVDQDERSRYLLGDEFLRMAFAHHEARPDHVRVHPVLEALARRFGETAHYAVLDGRDVVYRAKADPPSGAARLTSAVGGRNPAHATGVGKLLLSTRLDSLAAVEEWIGDRPLVRRTERTLCAADELHRDLEAVRERGYAVDDQESETGVCCVAVPAYTGAPSRPSGAVSVSALAYRTPVERLTASVEQIRAMLGPLGRAGT